MNQYQMNNIEKNYEGVIGIESEVAGLYYIIDDERDRIAICGEKGKTLLSFKQAVCLSKELCDVIDIYFRK